MTLAKRIIPCLDVDKGRVVKGVNFLNIRDAGDPIEIAKRYDEELSQLNLKLPFRDFANPSSLHLYPIQTNQRGRVFDLCHKEGMKVNVHYKPIHIQPFWQDKGFLPGDHPNSEAYYSKV